jgi:hypothetical protein
VVSAVGRLKGAPKPASQDAFLVQSLDGAATLVGVFDGHGYHGRAAAEQVSRAMANAASDVTRQAAAASPGWERSLWWDYDLGARPGNAACTAGVAADAGLATGPLTLDFGQSCLRVGGCGCGLNGEPHNTVRVLWLLPSDLHIQVRRVGLTVGPCLCCFWRGSAQLSGCGLHCFAMLAMRWKP